MATVPDTVAPLAGAAIVIAAVAAALGAAAFPLLAVVASAECRKESIRRAAIVMKINRIRRIEVFQEIIDIAPQGHYELAILNPFAAFKCHKLLDNMPKCFKNATYILLHL